MPRIQLRIEIDSDLETCFDLARNIDFHTESLSHTCEKAVAGVSSGLIAMDESVTWQANHFGLNLQLTSKITQFNRPHSFRDSMVQGPFRRFDHDHLFETKANKTIMTDIFDYESPFGIVGIVADKIFLEKYMTNLLLKRNELLKKAAEKPE